MSKKVQQGKWGVCVVAIVVGCVALLAPPLYDRFSNVPLNPLGSAVQFYNIDFSKIEVREGDTGFQFFAKKHVRNGEVLLSIPRFLCVTPQDTSESDSGRSVSLLGEQVDVLLASKGSSASFKQIFLFGLFFLLERRNPLSPFQQWFQVTPPFNRHSGALYWHDSDLECVDESTKKDARAMRAGLLASVEVALIVCEGSPELCQEGPPSIEEMRWGLSMYFHFNIRDQAVVPFITFARFGSSNFGVDVVMNRKHGGLDVKSNGELQVGGEILNYFPRGPSTQLAARGIFDSASLGVDAPIDLGSVVSTPQGMKICGDHAHELIFGVNGRPRDALLSCYAWIIATPNQRRQFKDYRANVALMKQVYSGLYKVAESTLQRLPQGCHCDDEVLHSTFSSFELFTRRTLQMNLDHIADVIARM